MSTETVAPSDDKDVIELDDGGWARVRRLKIRDIKRSKELQHERGYEDTDLDAIDALTNGGVIVETHLGEVTPEFVENLTESDYIKLWLRAKGGDPNALAASSTGTRRSRNGKASQTKTTPDAKETNPTSG